MKVKFNKNEISEIASRVIDEAVKIKGNNAKVVALSGDLGAGKTTITKEIGNVLGIKESIISPTFVIMKIYKIDSRSKYFSHFKKLIHIDAYRLERGEELMQIGWKEIEKDKDNLIIIEWPERVKNVLSNDICFIKLGHIDDETRTIEF
jgi:tRNA threonylcarbamoyladenosine biosynthesis protein TsaE